MKKRVKKMWIKALRSGEFEQAFLGLRDLESGDVRYCCLGVLCELHRAHSKDPQRWRDDSYAGMCGTLPAEVMDWAGLDDDNPSVPLGQGNTLAGLNDDGKDFNYIAGVIETYL